MEDYARLPLASRRYIVRALDFGLRRGDYMARWAGSFFDMPANLARADLYAGIANVRPTVSVGAPLAASADALLRRCTAFDLQYDEMHHFMAYRFLYERLFGAGIRPHLAQAYSGAASSPSLTAEGRRQALAGITMFEQTEEHFDADEPQFFPEWDGD